MLAAYLMSSALGVLTAADLGADVGATGWAVWLLAAAAGIVAGLVIVKRRPLAGTITSCLGALFGIGAFLVPTLVARLLRIVAGAVWSYNLQAEGGRLPA